MAPTSRELMPPPPTPSRSESGRGRSDTWFPDKYHHGRVQLKRERSRSVSRHRLARERSMSRSRVADHHGRDRSMSRHRAVECGGRVMSHSRRGSMVAARQHKPLKSHPLVTSHTAQYPHGDADTTAAADHHQDDDANLADQFQMELDHYDEQIASLTPGEWPTPAGGSREPAMRLQGAQFSERKARELKSWNTASGILYGMHTACLRATDAVRAPGDYYAGLVLSAPFHSASAADEKWVSAADPHNTATPFGIVNSKYRKMVVVRVFGTHCLCLPIYTHNGKGLEGKDPSIHKEFVSIRDWNDKAAAPAEGPNDEIFAVKDGKFRGEFVVRGRSLVKLTEHYAHQFDAPATFEGYLDERNTSRLISLTKRAMNVW